MKWSFVLHGISATSAVLGLLTLFGGWVVEFGGYVFGFSEEHLFVDAGIFFLVSIAFGIGTLIHLKKE